MNVCPSKLDGTFAALEWEGLKRWAEVNWFNEKDGLRKAVRIHSEAVCRPRLLDEAPVEGSK